MRWGRLGRLVVGLVLAVVGPVCAQQSGPLSSAPERFQPWRPPSTLRSGHDSGPGVVATSSPDRKRRALIGGAIGAGAGVVLCTAISTLSDDSADGGISFCPFDTYLLMGAAGFVLGAAIGWVT